jgi:hypothetical protein
MIFGIPVGKIAPPQSAMNILILLLFITVSLRPCR